MGLFNKLKNVLFEEEEIEVPEIEIPEDIKINEKEKEQVRKKDSMKMTFDADEDIMSDRELFKAEPTFNFPLFDEEEFESVKKEEILEQPKFEPVEEPKTRVRNTTPIVDAPSSRSPQRSESRFEVKEPVHKESRKPREVREKKEKSSRESRKFTPSPVISPVYGVLDKNYKKEDVIAPKEDKKRIDVDSVRKKAFGTLEEDIEKTLNTPLREFYEEPKKEKVKIKEEKKKVELETDLQEMLKEPPKRKTKNLDDFLENAMDDIILTEEEEANSSYGSFNIEEEPMKSIEETKELEVLDRPKIKEEEEKSDETLENDLFDLIDSMYENREDGESL